MENSVEVVLHDSLVCDVIPHRISPNTLVCALWSPNCGGFLQFHVRICLAWLLCFLELAKTLLLVMIPTFKLRDKYFASQFCFVACRSTLTFSTSSNG